VKLRARLQRASLRHIYAPLVNLVILVPMVAYLVADTIVERRSIIENRLEVLESMADLLVQGIASDPNPDLAETVQLLERFGAQHPQLEIMVLDASGQVLAATQPERVSLSWHEPEIQAVLDGDEASSWALSEHDGLPVLDLTLPVPSDQRVGVRAVHIAEPQQRLDDEIRRTIVVDTLFVLLLMLLVTTMVNWITQRLIIRRLARMAERIGQTEWLRDETDELSGDELATLGRALATMMRRIEHTTADLRTTLAEKQDLVERVERFNEELAAQVAATRAELEAVQDELLRKERLSVLGELTAGLAHEIRNPLQIIRGTAELARRKRPHEAQALNDVIEEVTRLELLVRELLAYARPLELHRESMLVNRVVAQATDEVGRVSRFTAIDLEIPAQLRCHADETLLIRVLVNLISNAVESLPPQGGRVLISAVELPDGGVRIRIDDNGSGIAPEDQERIFDPFFSRKEAGVGMGLPLSRRIVEQHGGSLSVSLRAGSGTRAELTLPPE
jgi:signal transduction histidine kinase